MGIELLAVSLAVSAAGTVASTVQQSKARRARAEAGRVQGASETVRNRLERRRLARQERIRRARLVSEAESSGATGSSGLIGAQSALGANFGASVAGQTAQTLATRGVSAALQREADAVSRSAQISGFTSLVNKGISLGADAGIFGE